MDEPGAGTTYEGLRLCDFIQERLPVILREWERRVRSSPAAERLQGAVLRDHVPQLLARIAQVLGGCPGPQHALLQELPDKHALERLDEGYDLRTATEELSALRDTILELWEQEVGSAITVRQVRQLDQAIDEIIAASASRFAQARERTLKALDRVSSAALGTGALDTFLPQLMTVLLETVAAVDSVVILLRNEEDALYVRAAIGLEEGKLQGYSERMGEGFAGTVGARREPLLLRDAAMDPVVRSALARKLGIHALYGVPLIHEGRVIGVAYMGSRTAYDFSDDDKQLLRTMGQRATSLIVQAQLLERLRESEARLQAIVDHAPAAIYVKDSEGRFVLANRYLATLLHRSREELLGRTSQDLWPREVARPLIEADRRVLELGVPVTVEESLPQEDGPHTFLSVKFPMPGGRGRVAALGGISTDITDRKEAERAQALLVEAGTVLAQSLDMETTLKSIASLAVTHLADFCMVDLLGEDGQLHRLEVLSREPAHKELMQRTMRYPPQLDSTSPVAQVLKTGKAATADITPQWLDAAAQSAEHRAVLEALAPRSTVILPLKARGRMQGVMNLVSKEPGRMLRPSVVVVAQGLADRAAIAIDNARLFQEAREAVRVREDVVAIVSHDLRNPLNAISLSASTLIKREELDERTAKAAMRIYAAADRAHRLIRDLLDFTQARVGGIPLSPRPVELDELARQVVEELQSAYPERSFELRGVEDVHVEGDPDRLAQVMANLLGNAVQHSPKDTPVRVTVRGQGDMVLFEVHNQGAPIPAEQLPVLFEPFHRGREAGAATPGRSLGLGLYISRQIVTAHGGRIEVHSEEGEGTTFRVWLPRRSGG
ncbi:MAG: ATP-binding protein [Hyalangium sp.]|uniref:GAF domain-containing sensor histidine kinase n=1 Tax=Hyalangium sp. TaxID=2028555 RepID=UPI00389A46DE